MKLDIRRPTLVIAGLWNPAIFQPPWVAATVLNVPPGKEINFVELLDPEKPAPVNYFGDLGICVPPRRLELFANSRSGKIWSELEQLALKIVNTLPHTPIEALGVNFKFEDPDPDPAIIDKLRTSEGLEKQFQIEATTVRSRIRFDDCQLYLVREMQENKFMVDFNFHHVDMSVEKLDAILPGVINDRFKRASDVLGNLYDIKIEESAMAHEFPAAVAA